LKPTITIDERGAILHVTDPEGHGFAVPLNAETLNELGAQLAVALERVKAPETRGPFLWNLARAVVRELVPAKGSDGPSDPKQR
jgi:hypothetical protein